MSSSSVSRLFLTAVTSLATEQRMNTKFCFKLDKTPIGTYEMLQTVCGDETLNRSSIFDWFKRFQELRGDLQDDPRCGGPSTSRNADTIVNFREVVT
jgi:hypothetical protein